MIAGKRYQTEHKPGSDAGQLISSLKMALHEPPFQTELSSLRSDLRLLRAFDRRLHFVVSRPAACFNRSDNHENSEHLAVSLISLVM